jgi:hypothetical protein
MSWVGDSLELTKETGGVGHFPRQGNATPVWLRGRRITGCGESMCTATTIRAACWVLHESQLIIREVEARIHLVAASCSSIKEFVSLPSPSVSRISNSPVLTNRLCSDR